MSETAGEGTEYGDDDTRSVITSATITPSESASEIFSNPFNVLQPPSSSGSSTPRSHSFTKLPDPHDNESVITSQLSSTSTAKATLNTSFSNEPTSASSVLATESLVSARTGAQNDWYTQSDGDEYEEENPASTPFSPFEKTLQSLSLSENDDEDDGAGFWITPSNINKHKIRNHTTTNSMVLPTIASAPPPHRERRRSSASDRPGNPAGAVMKSACMSGDFAIQNVALQMGLNLVSVEGSERIKSVKTWVLRCHGCFTYPRPLNLRLIGGSRRRWI